MPLRSNGENFEIGYSVINPMDFSSSVQLQTNNKTFFGRHWTEHTVLRRYFATDAGLSILSFGCSTGEELATLRVLFPGARLFGCDIDWRNLQAARALIGSDACVFASDDETIARHGPYDIVICNSVLLQSTAGADGIGRGIDPELWSHVLTVLDRSLRPGGVLQVVNSNIPFRFHPLAANYIPLRTPLILGPSFVDMYDPSGLFLCRGVAGMGWSGVLNRHIAECGWKNLEPTDFTDVHFWKRGSVPAPLPVLDETLPNRVAGTVLVSGNCTYRPAGIHDSRPSTYVEVDVTWSAHGVDSVRLERAARRVWFDGSVIEMGATKVDLEGPEAGAFLDGAVGRRSSRISVDRLMVPSAIRSPSV